MCFEWSVWIHPIHGKYQYVKVISLYIYDCYNDSYRVLNSSASFAICIAPNLHVHRSNKESLIDRPVDQLFSELISWYFITILICCRVYWRVDISHCCPRLVSEWRHDFGVDCLPQLLCKTSHSLMLIRLEKLSTGTSLRLIFDLHICVYFVNGPPTHSVGWPVLFCSLASVVCSLSSVIVCNTPWRAGRRLHPHMTGDDFVPSAV